MAKVLSLPPFKDRPEYGDWLHGYYTDVMDHIPATLKARARKWPLLGAEVELPYIDRDVANDGLDGAAIVKADGSIPESGGEVVYHPMSYRALRARFARLASDTGCSTLRNVDGCGTHIHLSPAWSISADDLRVAFNAFSPCDLDALCGRTETEYCHRNGSLSSHSSAVHTSRHGTIEIRHAQGTTDPRRLGAWLDTVYAVARALRKGVAPHNVPALVLASQTPDMAHALASGPLCDEDYVASFYCGSCDRRRAEDDQCAECRYCARCCECTMCESCGAANESMCRNCSSCGSCCDCAPCSSCGVRVSDMDDLCGCDAHEGMCEGCCAEMTCYDCDAPVAEFPQPYRVRIQRRFHFATRVVCADCAPARREDARLRADIAQAVVTAAFVRFIGPRRTFVGYEWDNIQGRSFEAYRMTELSDAIYRARMEGVIPTQ